MKIWLRPWKIISMLINIMLISLGICLAPNLFAEELRTLHLLRVRGHLRANLAGTSMRLWVLMFSISCTNDMTMVTKSTTWLRMNRGGRNWSLTNTLLVVLTLMVGCIVVKRVMVVAAGVAIVVVLKRITNVIMTIMATMERIWREFFSFQECLL
jgi:hypothetical protein